MAKGYWIGRVDVSNEEGYKPYSAANAAIFRKYGGRFVVRAGKFEAVEGAKRIEVGRVVTRVEGPPQLALAQQPADRRSLVRLDRRQELEHLAAEARFEARGTGGGRDVLQLPSRGFLVQRAAVVERDAQALVLGRPCHSRGELL